MYNVVLLTIFAVLLKPLRPQNTPLLRASIGSCDRLTQADIGRSDALSRDGLLPWVLITGDSASKIDNLPIIRIRHLRFVCEAAGAWRDTISSVSFLVTYDYCLTAICLPQDVETRTEQFQFDCNTGNSFFPPSKLYGLPTRRTDPVSTNSTALQDDCWECAAPRSDSTDNATHCASE